jgi:cation transport ATPase
MMNKVPPPQEPSRTRKSATADWLMLVVIPLVVVLTFFFYRRWQDLASAGAGAFLGMVLGYFLRNHAGKRILAWEAALETMAIGSFLFLFFSYWSGLQASWQTIFSGIALLLLGIFWGYLLTTILRKTRRWGSGLDLEKRRSRL